MTLAQNAQVREAWKRFGRLMDAGATLGNAQAILDARANVESVIRLALLAEWSAGEGLDFYEAATDSEMELADTRDVARIRGVRWINNQMLPWRQSFFDALNAQHRARLAAEREKWRAEVETLKARVEELDRECEATAASVTRWVEHHRKAEARVQRLEAAHKQIRFWAEAVRAAYADDPNSTASTAAVNILAALLPEETTNE